MSDNGKIIDKEFIQQWEEKTQKKKREFLDEMTYEKEVLERCSFFHLDLEDEDDSLTNGAMISIKSSQIKGKSLMSKGINLSNYTKYSFSFYLQISSSI